MNRGRTTAALFALTLSTGTALAACNAEGEGGSSPAATPTGEKSETPSEPADSPTADTPDATGHPSGKRSPDNGSSRASGIVERIVDGDTLVVRGKGGYLPKGASVRVRLLEIDAPEAGDCFSREATSRLAELLPEGSSLRVERDEDLKDNYGRYLLYIWNEHSEFVNRSLVANGYAESALYQPNDKYWQTISHAGDAAERKGAGVWAGCEAEPGAPPPPPYPETPEPDTPDDSYPQGPPADAPDVDCSDLPGPVRVGPGDPHRLDSDGDGIGCDTN